MSYDVLIIKPRDNSVENLSTVEDVAPLGEKYLVESAINTVFPGAINGVWQCSEFSVEALISGNPVESVHITLRFGDSWSETSEAHFLNLTACICSKIDAVAFSVSDNSKLSP
jgi:hypothetical protein